MSALDNEDIAALGSAHPKGSRAGRDRRATPEPGDHRRIVVPSDRGAHRELLPRDQRRDPEPRSRRRGRRAHSRPTCSSSSIGPATARTTPSRRAPRPISCSAMSPRPEPRWKRRRSARRRLRRGVDDAAPVADDLCDHRRRRERALRARRTGRRALLRPHHRRRRRKRPLPQFRRGRRRDPLAEADLASTRRLRVRVARERRRHLVGRSAARSGAELHVVLPFALEEFLRTSVATVRAAMGAPVPRVPRRRPSVTYATDGGFLGDDVLFGVRRGARDGSRVAAGALSRCRRVPARALRRRGRRRQPVGTASRHLAVALYRSRRRDDRSERERSRARGTRHDRSTRAATPSESSARS